MKKGIVFLFILLSSSLIAQDIKDVVLKTEVSEATVFIRGAQVLRKNNADIPSGRSVLRITDLSPYIDAKSIQLKIDGEVMVLSVNHQLSYKDTVKQSQEYNKLDTELDALNDKLLSEQVNKDVISEEIAFLRDNRNIKGANENLTFSSLKEISAYYTDRMFILRTREIEVNKKIKKLTEERLKINSKMLLTTNKQQDLMGEILVSIDNKIPLKNVPVQVTYYVNNAGWYPSYDIKAKNISEPISLLYKANITQNTKEDWKNIKLKVSSANPNLGSVAPKLKTYFLDYYRQPPKYDNNSFSNQARGRVFDDQREPLAGASVVIKGTTIGTTTDENGAFAISLPANARDIEVNFIGFIPQTLPVSGSEMIVYLQENASMLEEAIVIGYGSSSNTRTSASISKVDIKAAKAISVPVTQVENQTSIEFEIKTPYTILSTNKLTTVDMERYELPAKYEYYSVPKIDKDAFLLAYVTNWEQYNLLEGEANIFFENTFVGKTVLDVRYISDTLNLSLGRDKNVLIQREKVKDHTSKKILGTKNEVTRAWNITVKNNKRQPISFVLLDQVPVSTMSEIEVNIENLSKGNLDKETGEVKWKFDLNPTEKKDVEMIYKVKYPKNRTLTIE